MTLAFPRQNNLQLTILPGPLWSCLAGHSVNTSWLLAQCACPQTHWLHNTVTTKKSKTPLLLAIAAFHFRIHFLTITLQCLSLSKLHAQVCMQCEWILMYITCACLLNACSVSTLTLQLSALPFDSALLYCKSRQFVYVDSAAKYIVHQQCFVVLYMQ